jgi:hypothetical protein
MDGPRGYTAGAAALALVCLAGQYVHAQSATGSQTLGQRIALIQGAYPSGPALTASGLQGLNAQQWAKHAQHVG